MSLRTFLVEDSPLVRDGLSAMLQDLTPVRIVGTAADESAALAQMRKMDGSLDLLIVDLFLASGSGLGVLQSALRASSTARCVILTNYSSTEMRRRCSAMGADGVFDKSSELDELVAYCIRLHGAISPAAGERVN